jgi:hypothetical protein
MSEGGAGPAWVRAWVERPAGTSASGGRPAQALAWAERLAGTSECRGGPARVRGRAESPAGMSTGGGGPARAQARAERPAWASVTVRAEVGEVAEEARAVAARDGRGGVDWGGEFTDRKRKKGRRAGDIYTPAIWYWVNISPIPKVPIGNTPPFWYWVEISTGYQMGGDLHRVPKWVGLFRFRPFQFFFIFCFVLFSFSFPFSSSMINF